MLLFPIEPYMYMEHLAVLDSMQAPLRVLPPSLCAIVTPLKWAAWDSQLSTHPDQRFRSYIVNGIRFGFKVGFDYSRQLRSASANMASSRLVPQLITDYLAEECAEGRIISSVPSAILPAVHISRFGLIPKKAPGEWRLIVDLSSPEGMSVNDGICSLRYILVEDALSLIRELGRGALLARWISGKLIGTFLSSLRIGSFWACGGKGSPLSMQPFRLASARHPRFSRQWQMLLNGLPGNTRFLALCTIWAIF